MQKDVDILADIIARGLGIPMDRRCFSAYEGQLAALEDMREPIMPRGGNTTPRSLQLSL